DQRRLPKASAFLRFSTFYFLRARLLQKRRDPSIARSTYRRAPRNPFPYAGNRCPHLSPASYRYRTNRREASFFSPGSVRRRSEERRVGKERRSKWWSEH